MAHTMKHAARKWALPLVAFALGLSACNKTEEDSGTKDIENFSRDAGTELALNHCGPDAESPFVRDLMAETSKKFKSQIKASPSGEKTIRSVLSAAPRGLLVYYFGIGGRIEAKPKVAASDCRMNAVEAKYAQEGTSSLKSCWQKDEGKAPVIYVEDSESAIRHSLIRSLALVYADIYVQNEVKKGSAAAKGFVEQMGKLADAYLTVMATKSKPVHDAMKAIQSQDSALFGRMVWAETTDSLYCRRSTFDSVWAKTRASQQNGKAVQVANPFRPLANVWKSESLHFFYPASLDGVKGEAGKKNKLDCPFFFASESACQDAFKN